MRTTANYGWPVEQQGDTRRDFPSRVDGPRSDAIDAKMKQLADQLEVAATTQAAWTVGAGWTEHTGAGSGQLHVTRSGKVVILTGLVKPTSDLAMTAGTVYTVGTIPAGFRPVAQSVQNIGLLYQGSSVSQFCRMYATSAGQVQFAPNSAATFMSVGFLTVHLHYRLA